MRTDGQTNMTKLIVAFRNFAKAPKNLCSYSVDQQLKLVLSLSPNASTRFHLKTEAVPVCEML